LKTEKKMDKVLEKVVTSNQTKKHMFGTTLAFQQRDLAFGISFHGEIITKGPPPKCVQAYGVIFFLLGRT